MEMDIGMNIDRVWVIQSGMIFLQVNGCLLRLGVV